MAKPHTRFMLVQTMSPLLSNRGAIWVVGSHGPKASCVTWESRSPIWRGNSGGWGAHCKL